MTDLKRRAFLKSASCFAALQGTGALASAYGGDASATSFPAIDTHIHLFDPTRPGGVPWPEPTDTVLYRPSLPPRYESLSAPFGVVGAIAVECSPLSADNDWLLNVAAKNSIMVGVIGNLDPALPEFPGHLERLAANPLFRGIRYGNLWGRSLGAHLNSPEFIANLRWLSAAGLLMESANPNPVLIAEILNLTDRVPDLRIVIDHLPQAVPPADPAARNSYEKDLRALGRRSNVFVKGSEVLRAVNGKVSTDLDFYKSWLDEIWEIFGEDRMLFGSDWPNGDHVAPYPATFDIIKQYVSTKAPQARQKFFWKNSIEVYRWSSRTAAQRKLTA